MARERIAIDARSRASRMAVKANETLTGTRVITVAEIERYNSMNFDPGGAGRTVTLPAVAQSEGVVLYIANTADAAEILTIQNAAAATIVTPTQAEACVLWCDGVRWYGMVGASS